MVHRRAALVSLVICLFVCLPAFAVTRSWTGAASANWSNPSNWSPAGAPAAFEPLVFPAGAANTTMTNDLLGLSVGTMTISTSYTINGNELTLMGDVVMTGFSYSFTCNAPLKLGTSVHIDGVTGNAYNGGIDVNGQTLTVYSYATSVAGLNGSGTVNVAGNGITPLVVTGNGTFNGSITGPLEVLGSIPNANVTINNNVGPIAGTGTVGMVTMTNAYLSPGAILANPSTGVLHTKSLSMAGASAYVVELAPGSVSDSVQVTGTVTLSGQLGITLSSGAPQVGQNFTIIDNDGTDPVNGTFTGMPEGTMVTLGTSKMMITYAGGDGNDVVLKTVSAVKTWTGSVSGNWSNPSNWSPAGTPAAFEPLVFPAGAANTTMTNDLLGLSVGTMTISTSYTINGNELTLMGDVVMTGFSYSFTCNAPLKLGTSVHIDAVTSSAYNGGIDVNGKTLTINSYSTSVAGLNGSGTVNVAGNPLTVTGNGSFNGSINGPIEALGSIPNANVTINTNVGPIAGTGTVGTVTMTNAYLSPGAILANPSTGVLHTKSLSMAGASAYVVELAPGSVSDSVQVTGTVTLSGQLGITLSSGAPQVGQSFTIIDNDGTDAVNGTFTGMPEGTTVTLGTSKMMITYAGGDGNDVVLKTVSAVKTWTGAVSANWSNPSNWSPAGAPAAFEPLVFPAGAANTTMTNDLLGLSVGVMTISTSYTINGNELTLMGDVVMTGFSYSFTCNAPLKLGTSVHIDALTSSAYNGGIDVNGKTLTINSYSTSVAGLNGSGTVNVAGNALTVTGNGSFNGSINGPIEALGSIPNANVTINTNVGPIAGTGTVGTVTMTNAYLSPGAILANPSTGVLHTKSLSMAGASAYVVELAPGSVSDSVQVTGTVTLSGQLGITLSSGAPQVGQTFTIIDNDGTDAVNGTFTGMPERTTVPLVAQRARISYQGGDGNDVVLAVLADTGSVLSQNASETKVGEPWTLTATVSSAFGVPAGSVSFSADGVSLGTAAAVNGVASLTITPATVGTRHVTATFLGTGVYADSVSAVLSHVVSRGQTTTQLAADHQSSVYGQAVRFTATVSAVAPAAGQPGGNVTFLADGTTLGTVPVASGMATFETASLHAGLRAITASYSGDSNFESSTASALQQSVAKAPTRVDASTHSVPIGASPAISVSVNVPARSDLVPSGNVTVSDAGVVLGVSPLAHGVASLTLAPLSAGDHTLLFAFSGDSDFEASSATAVQTVTLPAISCTGTHVLEGNHGVTTATVVVSLSAPVQVRVRVSFSTVAGNATEGEDYEKASGVIEFAPGEVTRAIELHISGDTFPEPAEAFSVLLFDAENATIDSPSASVVIVNDDQVPPRHRPSRP